MLRPVLPLLLATAFAGPRAAEAVLDQESPYANAWLWCHDPADVWQQQVRVGVDGILYAAEVAIAGPAGAHVELRVRAGDGWSGGPVLWMGAHVKSGAGEERPTFDLLGAGLAFSAGDTFVLEAWGSGGAELRGSWVHPAVGPPLYPEELYLSGPGCYDDCGWRMGLSTWMVPAQASAEVVRLGIPPNPAALLPGATGGPALGTTWEPSVDHAAFAPAATLDVLAIASVPLDVPTPLGTLLCDPATIVALVPAPPGAGFGVPIPSDGDLVGLALTAQAASIDGGGTALLTNALDVVVGTF
jgi:hypothetical protein